MRKLVARAIASRYTTPFVSSEVLRTVIRRLPEHLRARIVLNMKQHQTLDVFPSGVPLKLGTSALDDHFSSAYLTEMRDWEVGALAAWRWACEGSGAVVDVGAYLGVYSCVAAKSGVTSVLAFEPNPRSARLARKNIEVNDLADVITLRELALSEQRGYRELLTPDGRALSSGARLASSIGDRERSEWPVLLSVPTSSLDHEIDKTTFQRVGAIKIDVEGTELEVLKGGIRTIRRDRPTLLVEFLERERLNWATAWLQDLGYSDPLPLDGPSLLDHSVDEIAQPRQTARNYLFVHRANAMYLADG